MVTGDTSVEQLNLIYALVKKKEKKNRDKIIIKCNYYLRKCAVVLVDWALPCLESLLCLLLSIKQSVEITTGNNKNIGTFKSIWIHLLIKILLCREGKKVFKKVYLDTAEADVSPI